RPAGATLPPAPDPPGGHGRSPGWNPAVPSVRRRARGRKMRPCRAAARSGNCASTPRSSRRSVSLIRLEGIVREVGTFVILDQVTAAIAPGERVGLVGPNGAG